MEIKFLSNFTNIQMDRTNLKSSPWKLFSPTLNVQCSDCPVRQHTVCADCGPSELEKLDVLKRYKTFQAGQTIVRAGAKVEFLGSIMRGVAALSRGLNDGRRQMVGLLLPSHFIGRIKQDVSPFDIEAVDEVTICQFPKPLLEALVLSSPAFERRLLKVALDELDTAREWMLLLGRKTAREKVASLLVIIACHDAAQNGYGSEDRMFFPVLINRRLMANYLGLTIETVSRELSALKKDGIIVLDGYYSICVTDFQTLVYEAGDDADGGIIP
jgi:CRP/FNR family transcriptional regulator, anaerobic regulatory protein